MRLGFLARYQDGQHFARLVLVNGLNQGPEIVRAFRNGRTRFTYSMTFDARFQKGFTFGTRHLDVIVDGYNVFNTATEVEEFVVTGPTSRRRPPCSRRARSTPDCGSRSKMKRPSSPRDHRVYNAGFLKGVP